MIKYRLLFDKEVETKWLNELADEGWALKKFFAGFYSFEPCEKGEFTYQIDMGNKFGCSDNDYKNFMEENKIEVVQNWGFWVILRKRRADGEFELYTDVDSQIEYFTKILKMFKAVTIFEFVLLMINSLIASEADSIINWICIIIMVLMTIAICRATVKTSEKVRMLKAQKSGIEEQEKGMSTVLLAGLLVNSVGLIVGDRLSNYIRIPIQILAIVLMLVGIFAAFEKRKKEI